ncbi:MAG TPA: hypothetical protein VFS39_01235, partial [Nitrospira sp.]|nr:hypothetical protein [Nitrospira sp.]
MYAGIMQALPAQTTLQQDEVRGRTEDQPPAAQETVSTDKVQGYENPKEPTSPGSETPIALPLHQAIEAGALIGVTSSARQLGIALPVTVTKPLWELGIAPAAATEEERV